MVVGIPFPWWAISLVAGLAVVGLRHIAVWFLEWLATSIVWDRVESGGDNDPANQPLTPEARKGRQRLIEDGALVPFYLLFTLYDAFVLRHRPWFLEWFECAFASTDQLRADPITYFYYMVVLAFYVQALLSLVLFEERRSDHRLMVIHHVTTWLLVFSSMIDGRWMVGTSVMFCHNLVDTMLFLMMCIRYVTRNKAHRGLSFLAYATFGAFAVSFFATRIVIFSTVIRHCIADWTVSTPYALHYHDLGQVVIGDFGWDAVLSVLGLCILYCMHVYWFWLILKMLYRAVTIGVDAKDARDG